MKDEKYIEKYIKQYLIDKQIPEEKKEIISTLIRMLNNELEEFMYKKSLEYLLYGETKN